MKDELDVCHSSFILPPSSFSHYSRSVTFQYASLMNFDQLSIRTLWSA